MKRVIWSVVAIVVGGQIVLVAVVKLARSVVSPRMASRTPASETSQVPADPPPCSPQPWGRRYQGPPYQWQ
jgi:hypothetical protein